MYAGYDDKRGFQLYSSDPSGNYYSWKAHVTAQSNSVLKNSDYDEEMSLKDGLKLAVKVIHKSLDAHEPSTDRFEVNYLTKDENDNLIQKELDDDLLKELIETVAKEAEDEKDKN